MNGVAVHWSTVTSRLLGKAVCSLILCFLLFYMEGSDSSFAQLCMFLSGSEGGIASGKSTSAGLCPEPDLAWLAHLAGVGKWPTLPWVLPGTLWGMGSGHCFLCQGDDRLTLVSFLSYFFLGIWFQGTHHTCLFKMSYTNNLAKLVLCLIPFSSPLFFSKNKPSPLSTLFLPFFPTGNETICVFLALGLYLRFFFARTEQLPVGLKVQAQSRPLPEAKGLGDIQVQVEHKCAHAPGRDSEVGAHW